ncbi:MAG: hypothetical protein CMK72_16155 [Pseudomonadaceae bacterium]|nr:hypothetical protein [Pseudomonadaceae bacterium]HCP53548.1 hypothetical protein [Pseudomonas sp.]
MSKLGESLRALRARGFAPVAARSPARSFKGELVCKRGMVSIKLTISDWDFLSYPHIQVLERQDFLPELMPHVDVAGNLCYFAPGSVTLDRYKPATAILQCLDQATAILDRISLDPNYRIEDIQNEFPAHWEYGQLSPPWQVLLGEIKPNATTANYFILEIRDKRRALISNVPDEATRLADALGAKLKPSHFQCWILRTKSLPAVPQKMPTTVKELFDWIKIWDQALYSRLQNILGQRDYLKQSYLPFAIETPVGWLGFGFDLDRTRRETYSRDPKKYRQYLHMKGGSQSLFRMAIKEVSARFVHSRNLSYEDLQDKRVTVVGCGAIGSFIAQALVRLGAGTGERGVLKIIDSDKLGPENLGRHALGFPSLFRYKTEALQEELLRQFPHSKIIGTASSAFEHKQLFDADLIIDATGEEAVSELLNGLRLNRNTKAPVLHVWIRGNGEAVQALWTDATGGGCYRCLTIPDPNHHRKERFELLKTAPVQHTDGCRAFTPYAVSAPLHASALAIDMICSWLQGSPSPKFRTRSVEGADVYKLRNHDPSKLKSCPACDLT